MAGAANRSGFVAIIGRPNSGKSTLLNAYLGTRLSIVTPKAQTTRERVLGILTEESRGQMVFVDTPGVHRAREGGINAYMMSEAREALEGTSLVWYLVDPASELRHERVVMDLLGVRPPGDAAAPILILMNKADLLSGRRRERALALLGELGAGLREQGHRVEREMLISATQGRGLAELLERSWELLPEGPLHYPDVEQISDRPVRYFVAEKIREQLLMKLGEELPYSCAVEIGKFVEPRAGSAGGPKADLLTRIEATIYVERESQKGMVIGRGGGKIKEIGQAARHEIERFVGGPVFLGLQVKVLREWSRDAEALKKMGYHLPVRAKGRDRIVS